MPKFEDSKNNRLFLFNEKKPSHRLLRILRVKLYSSMQKASLVVNLKVIRLTKLDHGSTKRTKFFRCKSEGGPLRLKIAQIFLYTKYPPIGFAQFSDQCSTILYKYLLFSKNQEFYYFMNTFLNNINQQGIRKIIIKRIN